MNEDWREYDIEGVVFESIGTRRTVSQPDRFGVRKSAWMIERYLELADEFAGGDVVELGIDQGSSTAMLALALKPRMLAAFDLTAERLPQLDDFVAAHGLADSVHLGWGLDQSDRTALLEQLEHCFQDRPLDLVIDDASHLLHPTAASFDVLFPRLRPGGLFIIEDWSHEHALDREIARAFRDGGADLDTAHARLSEALTAETTAPVPLSRLLVQLLVATAYVPDVVSDIRVREDWCEVRRGAAQIEPPFVLADQLGSLAARVIADD